MYHFPQPLLSAPAQLSRRHFLGKTALACSSAALCLKHTGSSGAAELATCPVAVFSKIYQELKLNFQEAAELSAEAGLDGVDCPVRPGGEVLPERAVDDLPRYAEFLGKNKQRLLLLTTSITGVTTPYAEDVLKVSAKLGLRFYRLGFFQPRKDISFDQYAREIRARLKELLALNRQFGMTALFQNHSGSVGANLSQMRVILDGFVASELGLAFDLGHALLEHGDAWKTHFEHLKPYLQVAYIKDAKRGVGWVPFGEGDMAGTGYFGMLKALGYQAPFSLHIEFDWSEKGKAKTRPKLLQALRNSTRTLRNWLSNA